MGSRPAGGSSQARAAGGTVTSGVDTDRERQDLEFSHRRASTSGSILQHGPAFSSFKEDQSERSLAARQMMLDNAWMRHPQLVALCAVATLVSEEPARAASLSALHERVTVVRQQGVLFQGYGHQGQLNVPTFSVEGVEYTPPASECLCMSSSPIAPVAGGRTRFFGWELLDMLGLLVLKGGISVTGEDRRRLLSPSDGCARGNWGF